MDINYFDLVIGGIILLLGLKGIINGFFKELFGLIGIVGGIFIASRYSEEVGSYLSDLVFKFNSDAAIKFTGFLVVLGVFWIAMVVVGIVFKKLSSASGLGPVDRLLGFVLGTGKFFFIVSIIAYALNNVNVIHQNIQKPMENSILFPIMIETGQFIMKLDPVQTSQTLQEKQEKIQESINETINQHVTQAVEEKAKEVTKNISEHIDDAKDLTKDH